MLDMGRAAHFREDGTSLRGCTQFSYSLMIRTPLPSNLTWLDFPLLQCTPICQVLFRVVWSIIRLVLTAVLSSDIFFFTN